MSLSLVVSGDDQSARRPSFGIKYIYTSDTNARGMKKRHADTRGVSSPGLARMHEWKRPVEEVGGEDTVLHTNRTPQEDPPLKKKGS